MVKEGDDGDNPVVKAGEDDGELINPRDRSWPDVLLSPALYVQTIPRSIPEVCIHVLVYSLLFSHLSLSSQYNATIGVRQLKTANNHPLKRVARTTSRK